MPGTPTVCLFTAGGGPGQSIHRRRRTPTVYSPPEADPASLFTAGGGPGQRPGLWDALYLLNER